MTSQDLLKIGEFARLADTNLRTLRYYEELGLLSPAERSDGGFRYYRRTDLNRMGMIRFLQGLGLQLENIRDLLNAREKTSDRRAWLASISLALKTQEGLIDERIRDLQGHKQEVAKAVAKLSDCAPCPHCPIAENNFCEPCQNTGQSLPDFLSALF